MNNDLIDQSLRALDPMPDEVPTDSLRAQRALDGIVVDRPARRSRSRTVTRLALAGGVAAALALSAVIVPGMSGTPVAYADWTTTATPIDRADKGGFLHIHGTGIQSHIHLHERDTRFRIPGQDGMVDR